LNNSGRKGKPISEHQKQRIREGIQNSRDLNPEKFDQAGNKNHMYGKVHSEETK